jgi:hypothetical protein
MADGEARKMESVAFKQQPALSASLIFFSAIKKRTCRFASPEGDYHIAMQLSDELAQRAQQMQLISRFMAWKQSPGFTMAGELMNPDAVYCYGATHKQEFAALAVIERNPIRFGAPQWLTPEQIGDDVRGLLPKGVIELDAGMIAELKDYFGAAGKFPAVHIESGRLGDL